MALPPWAVNAIRRGIADVARKAGDPETITKLKQQATEIFRDLPDTALRGVDSIVRTAKAGTESLQRWIDRHTELAVPMINASGRLLDCELGRGCPLSDEVLQIGCDLLRGDCKQQGLSAELQDRLRKRLAPHAIAVTASLEGAVAALTLQKDLSLAIHRSHAIRLPSGLPLPDALGQENLREIGGVQGIAAKDFEGLQNHLVILADAGSQPFQLPDLSEQETLVAVVLPVGTVRQRYESIPSAEAILEQGADLVILPGDVLAGGPPCGLIIGDKQRIDELLSCDRWQTLAAPDAIVAMVFAALEQADVDSSGSAVSSELGGAGSAGTESGGATTASLASLLDASEDNLRSRAERMATRLSAADSIASCQITSEPARLTKDGHWQFPSRQLRLRPEGRSAAQWAETLGSRNPAIAVDVADDQVVVDLRWVRAADDPALAAQLES